MSVGSTMLPGFMSPFGSSVFFTSANSLAMRSPSMVSRNSERSRPSPCSPECVPPYSRTTSCASSAIARMRRTSPGSRRLSAGRTCRQPTEACAYHVPSAPCLPNISSIRRAYSERCSSGTAQSSMNEIGFRGPAIDITMFRPALRTLQTAACSAGASARTTLSGKPSEPSNCSSSASFPPRSAPGASSENSTSRSAFGAPRTKPRIAVRWSGCAAASSSTF